MNDQDLDDVFISSGIDTSVRVDTVPAKGTEMTSSDTGKSHSSGGKLAPEKHKNQKLLKTSMASKTSSSKKPPNSTSAEKETRKRSVPESSSLDPANSKRHKSPPADKGKDKDIPSVADFEAFVQVGLGGAKVFKQLMELDAGKLTDRLRGKLSALEAENRYLDGELIRTTRDLQTYRDQNLVAFSEENWCLKDELKKLEDVQRRLDEANAKLSD